MSSSSIKETSKKVISSVVPSIEDHLSNKSFDSSKDGLDFLDVKNGLLLSYMIDLTKLLQYQQKNNSNNNQSSSSNKEQEKNDTAKKCLQRLNEMKVIIEKMRPLEKKMRYQIDKLLTISSSSSSFALGVEKEDSSEEKEDVVNADNEEEGEENGNLVQMEESDPLSFRPNLDGFGNDDDDDDDENENENETLADNDTDESEEDDDEILAAKAALGAERASSSKTKRTQNSDSGFEDEGNDVANHGVYKAPRLTAVPFAEKEKEKMREERLLKKQRDRMKKSELLSTLKATYGDMPEEDDFGGGASLGKQRESARRLVEHEAEKTQFEEDAFVRLTTSKKEKKMRNRIMREEVSNLHSIADIGNLTAGVAMAFGDERNDQNDDEIIRVSGSSRASSRHDNGKRRRENEYEDSVGRQPKRRNDPKNSYQKALFGINGKAGGKKKKSKK